ncbi:MAG TPA: type I polyketide synthase, partial [Solirubrobacteraceae bacterium]|nr:type I polyketide synthase [Solirubrobacteraceae bacterium]
MLSLLALDEEPSAQRGSVQRGLAGTLLLAQALEDLELKAPLWIATCGGVAAAASERIENPAQGLVWGLGRVIGLEQPARWGGLIDLPPVLEERGGLRLCMALGGSGEEDQLALRPAGMFARRLVRASSAASPSSSTWTPRGTVLVTGGTGGLGGHVARWLAASGAQHILLASRRGPSAPGARELVGELEAAGSQVTVAACDVGDRAQLQELLAAVPAELPLDAVIHAAGVIAEQPLGELTVERLEQELAGKAGAALALHELTADMELSAFVMFSSIAGVFGSAAQAGYAAGNAFLWSLAEHRAALGLAATSIAWGAWAGEGMAAAAGEQLNRRGIREMAPELALGALQQALDRSESSTVVADIDWERYALAYTAARRRPLIEEIAEVRDALAQSETATADAHQSDFAGELASLSAEGRERLALDFVRSHTAGVLGYRSGEDVAPDEAFKELGLDSLAAVDLRNRLQGALGTRLATTIVFDHPTPLALADYLIEELTGGIEEPATVKEPAHARSASGHEDPIAIVGIGCRLPGGVCSPGQLWELLSSGTDAISPFPSDRGWDQGDIYGADPDDGDTAQPREGGFLHDAGDFDAQFFGISPREALAMSPQQRLLLEVCWETLEQAGIDPHSLHGSATGVFMGEDISDYSTGLLGSTPRDVKAYLGTGNSGSVVSGRIAYTLGLQGPALTINTACSSSLVALHLAAASLSAGECALALIGGVAVMATPCVFVNFSLQGGSAPDGRCKSFADTADGAGWSEGVGVAALERLSDAQRNGHDVLAIVRGSAINQDGASNGLTAPNGAAQQRVIRQALANAGLRPPEVDAVEAHGTGTKLGDPIEALALLQTYGQERDGDPLWLGSLKSNIGHTQAAAGIAGVIKMILALAHERLPRTLHVAEPSTHVDWSLGAVRPLTEEMPWQRNGRPRRAGVSSFGISGTNAHVILEEPPAQASRNPAAESDANVWPSSGMLPWLLSARGEDALRAQGEKLREHVREDPSASSLDIAFSLASRADLEHRAVVLGEEREALLDGLDSLIEGHASPNVVKALASAGRGSLAFLFTGQGAQRAGMGSELYEAFPVFRRALEQAWLLLDEQLGCSLRELMFAPQGSSQASMLDQTAYTQAGLFAFELALFSLLEHWGIRPSYLIGHSVGEIAAAHVAGVLSLPDACTLVVARGRLMGELPRGGAMIAVQASEAEMRQAMAESSAEVALGAV